MLYVSIPQQIQIVEVLSFEMIASTFVLNYVSTTSQAFLTDTWADVEKTGYGDVLSFNKIIDLYGDLKQLYFHMKANRNLTTMLRDGRCGV